MKITRTLTQLRHAFLALVLVGFTANALAHAGLETSVPAANSQVKMSPPELVLTYEKPVMLMGLTVTDDKGKAVELNFKASNDTQLTHKFALPSLGNGQYTVNWVSMGKDGHNMKGAFAFSVGAEAKPAPAMKMKDGDKDHSGMDMDHSGHNK